MSMHSRPHQKSVRIRHLGIAFLLACLTNACTGDPKLSDAPAVFHAQGEMAGEVTDTTVLLQSRMTATDNLLDGDVPGSRGRMRFEMSTSKDFTNSVFTPWLKAIPEHDFIVRANISALAPGTRYYYRVEFGLSDDGDVTEGPVRTFRTLDPTGEEPIQLVVVTGMNYGKFHFGNNADGTGAYNGPDRPFGYPALEAILTLEPDLFISTGDSVYYDSPSHLPAVTTIAGMRRKWHEQFVQPRFQELFARVPTYWEKDDHDYRWDDSDPHMVGDPSHKLGTATFLEQLPVLPAGDSDTPTYRTHRLNRYCQVWFTEGRDYRSPDEMPDGPAKTLWGDVQRTWLMNTLLESKATFKILVSSTPLVGPDDAYRFLGPDDVHKRDNHVNHGGFRHEGDAFFRWLVESGFDPNTFFIVCGDRHWQYHSVHPSGFEEFSCGALVDANARLGRVPGDPKSTDPNALVRQLYTQKTPSGGFLSVTITPPEGNTPVLVTISFYDELGKLDYEVEKRGQ